MNTKQKQILILSILIISLFAINYNTLDSFLIKTFETRETAFVQRIVDGDTIIANNKSIRLLGINCPEKGELYSNEAKEFLENLILNKTIILESTGTDLYNRTLAHLFYKNKNINLEIVENGFANAYYPKGKQKYYSDFQNAWKECVKENINFCKISEDKCSNCINLKEFNPKNEIIELENSCDFDCDLSSWSIKDEGRKKFIFPNFILESGKEIQIIVDEGQNSEDKLYWNGEKYVWTYSGDTMFLRDDKGGLILWKNY